MDAVKFLEEANRMRKSHPHLYNEIDRMNFKEYVTIVEVYSVTHPQKTRLSDFLEKYPEAELNEDGTPVACCGELGYCSSNCPDSLRCSTCWNTPL